ncbi:MAG: hypothetical protein OEO21_08730 [Candidatus Krumholzibacteria bacterium]|nr:hypothetical protein [Candidatus Krumholzibacteria bacterium]
MGPHLAIAGAAAAAAEALKASGAIVRVEPERFEHLVSRIEEPLIVRAHSRFLGERWEYLTGYKGLVFYTKAKAPLNLPGRAEIMDAKSISIPG